MPPDDFAKELAKLIPVERIYEDAGSPAAKQIGQIGEDLIKALQLALTPVQYLAALQDRFRRFIDTSVRRVPEQRRISPPPQILGPVIEGIRYEPEETPIDKMFSELLSRSMDSERVGEAHPSFPILIRQLSSDEAKILFLLSKATYSRVFVRAFDHASHLFCGAEVVEVDELPRDGFVYPVNVSFYFQHLDKLGLAGIFQDGNQEALFSESNHREQTGVRVRCKYTLTEFGQHFAKACIG
jgi:hypothetical protein